MIKEQIAAVIKERIRICEETDDNWDYGIEQCWKKIVAIFTVDIDKSINYFLNESTDEEFYWLSETFEEIAEQTKKKAFIGAWRSRLAKVTPEAYRQQNFKSEHMKKWIDYATYIKRVRTCIEFAEDRIKE